MDNNKKGNPFRSKKEDIMSEERKVWFNGELIPWEKATVHIFSHAFSRGSALFEVFAVFPSPRGPVAFRSDLHMRRLWNSAKFLGMELAQTREELEKAVAKTVQANRLNQGYVKIVAFWGIESFANLVPDVKLDMSIFAVPATVDYGDVSKPIGACIVKWRKIHPESVPVEAKAAGYYINAMLARREAYQRGFDQGIMLDTQGFVAEGSVEAVFMVKDGVLMTPPLGRILPSVSRQSVLDVARVIGIPAIEKAIKAEDLMTADELFTSCTVVRVLPIGRFENRTMEKAPGPISSRLIKVIDEIIAGRDERFKAWLKPL
jgi:branched-chain amino acid aminotransferase